MSVRAVEGKGGDLRSSGLVNQDAKQLFPVVDQISTFGNPSTLRHLLQWKTARVDFIQAEIERRAGFLQKHVSGYTKMLVQGARHRHSEITFPGKDLGDLGATANIGNEIPLGQVGLVHSELNGRDRVGQPNRVVLILVKLDKVGQFVKLFAFGCAFFCVKDFVDSR